MGMARSSIESLRGFLLLDGPIEEVVASLIGKGLTYRRKNMLNVKHVLAELNEVVVTSNVFGVKVRFPGEMVLVVYPKGGDEVLFMIICV